MTEYKTKIDTHAISDLIAYLGKDTFEIDWLIDIITNETIETYAFFDKPNNKKEIEKYLKSPYEFSEWGISEIDSDSYVFYAYDGSYIAEFKTLEEAQSEADRHGIKVDLDGWRKLVRMI